MSRLRVLFQLIQSLPWHPQPKIDKAWKEKVANDMLDKLNEAKYVFACSILVTLTSLMQW